MLRTSDIYTGAVMLLSLFLAFLGLEVIAYRKVVVAWRQAQAALASVRIGGAPLSALVQPGSVLWIEQKQMVCVQLQDGMLTRRALKAARTKKK